MSAVQPGNLKDVRLCAAQWLERQEQPGWCAADRAELEAWLEADPAHAVAYFRVELAWQRTARLAALRGPERLRPITQKAGKTGAFKAAVGFALAGIVAAGIFFATRDPGQRVYATAVGERKVLALPDGSRIELNTNTVLRISKSDARRVWLDRGEAFFHVVHDSAHPFVVDAGARRITDLGTEFVIRQDDARFKVAVLEGRVSVAAKANAAQSLLLVRGDSAEATGSALAVKNNAPANIAGALGWRRGVLVFDNITLGEAAAEFNRYTTGRIVVSDAQVAGLRVVGTFPTDGVAGFVDVARHILNLRVEKRGADTIISK